MFDELKFRESHDDGRHVAILIGCTIGFLISCEVIGVPLSMLVAGVALGFLSSRK